MFEIKDDPWNRDFAKAKDTFYADEMGLLCMVIHKLSKNKSDCGVLYEKMGQKELIAKYPIRNFEFRENYVIGYGDAYWYPAMPTQIVTFNETGNMIRGIVNGKTELHGQVTMRIKMFYFVG